MVRHHVFNSIFLAFLIIFLSCNSNDESGKKAKPAAIEIPPIAPGSFNDNSGIPFDSASISKFLSEKPLFMEFKPDFEKFYRANNYSFVWYGKSGLIETSSALIASLADVENEAVAAKIPYKDSLDALLHYNLDSSRILKPNLEVELMLTGQYFNYAKNIWAGAANNDAEKVDWYLPRKKLSYTDLLNANLSQGNLGAESSPVVQRQYEGLKKALVLYRDIERSTDSSIVPSIPKNKIYKIGDSATVIPVLRKKLSRLGYKTRDMSNSTFDTTLANVIKVARLQYGLKPEPVITNDFITELNVPAVKRIKQIMVNMERLRWMVSIDTTAREFIFVNIPEYRLHYFSDKNIAWECNVVVGKPMTKTVIFSGNLKYVVFSPYWNVPQSIINKEVKPGMTKNANYLTKHNMEWNNGQVRQKPGPQNSLGLVKFLFPNSNNIYLHDTPVKSLFSEDQRAFSHGCIRVSKPKELAIRILADYPEWTEDKIDSAMHSGKEKTVTLKKTIPVYIGYFTAFIDKNGDINFRPDIYDRDTPLYDLLANK